MEETTPQKIPETTAVLEKSVLSNNFKYFLIALIVILIILLIGFGGYLLGQKNNRQNPVSQSKVKISTPTVTPTPTIGAASIEDTGITNQKRYTNPQVGISFIFPSKSGDDPIDVKEVGNKIFVYDTKFAYTQGQYIEVFQKPIEDSLTQAIQTQLLANISQKDCFVKDAKPDQAANFPSSFEVKTLGYPVDPNSDLPSFAQPNKCPTPYAETNGMSYFLGDTKHPKIFLFFSIGQQALIIDNKTNETWQDTIEFIN